MKEETAPYPIRHRAPLWMSLPLFVGAVVATAAFWGLRHRLGWPAYLAVLGFVIGGLAATLRTETILSAIRREARQRHYLLGWLPTRQRVFRAADLESVTLSTQLRRDGSRSGTRLALWTISLRTPNGRQYPVKCFWRRGQAGPPREAEALQRQLSNDLGVRGDLRYESAPINVTRLG